LINLPTRLEHTALSQGDLHKLLWYHRRYTEEFYAEYSYGHFILAAYAAVPAFLTPDLLYQLWQNFNAYKWAGKPVNIHRVAVADLLLSPLCTQIGFELYEMNYEIRMVFLDWLKREEEDEKSIWKKREICTIEQLALFVEKYHEIPHAAGQRWGSSYLQSQALEAISYNKPGEVIKLLLGKIKQAAVRSETDLLQLINMFVKTKQRVERLDTSNKYLFNQFDNQVAFMEAWKTLIQRNGDAFIEQVNSRPEILDLLKSSNDGGIEIKVSGGVVEKLELLTERKLRVMVVGSGFSMQSDADQNSADLFADCFRSLYPAGQLLMTHLTNEKTSKDIILKHWEEQVRLSSQRDDLVLYIASSSKADEDHCYIACADSGDFISVRESWLQDEEIGRLASLSRARSVTIIVQADHASTRYWLDTSAEGRLLIATSKYDQQPTFFTVEENDKEYCAFTFELVGVLRKKGIAISNRDLFLETLRAYEAIEGKEDSNRYYFISKTPQLFCRAEMYDSFFVQGQDPTVSLQHLLRVSGYTDEKPTGKWNRNSAHALRLYCRLNSISETLSKQEYIMMLSKVSEDLESRDRLFLIIFSNTSGELDGISEERDQIRNIMNKVGPKIRMLILDDPSKQDLVAVFSERTNRNKIEFIYFSGNDDRGNFHFHDGPMNIVEFGELLVFQANCRLLVSNTCRSQFFAEYSTQLGIAVAVGAETLISDRKASRAAWYFFEGLLHGESPEHIIPQHFPYGSADSLDRYDSYKIFRANWIKSDERLLKPFSFRQPSDRPPAEVYSVVIGFEQYPILGYTPAEIASSHFLSWLKEQEGCSEIRTVFNSENKPVVANDIDNAFAQVIAAAKTSIRFNNIHQEKRLIVYLNGKGIENLINPLFVMPEATVPADHEALDLQSWFSTLLNLQVFHSVFMFYDLEQEELNITQVRPPSFVAPIPLLSGNGLLMGNFTGNTSTDEHGHFTRVLLDGLKGKATGSEGEVTARSLQAFMNSAFASAQAVVVGNESDQPTVSEHEELAFQSVIIRFVHDLVKQDFQLSDSSGALLESGTIYEAEHSYELKPGAYKITVPSKHISKDFVIEPSSGSTVISVGWKFKNKWIAVLGTGGRLQENEIKACSDIAALLANKGFGLVTGGWPGVDHESATIYYDNIEKLDKGKGDECLLQVVAEGMELEFQKGRIEYVNEEEWMKIVMEKCVAIITIGGTGYTYEMFKYVRGHSLPVIPLPYTKGDSQKIYRYLLKNEGSPNSVYENSTNSETGNNASAANGNGSIPAELLSQLGSLSKYDDPTELFDKILNTIFTVQNPFKGLLPYTPEDHEHFYGRQWLLYDWQDHNGLNLGLREAVMKFPVVLITGSAGIGKTSLINFSITEFLRQLTIETGAGLRYIVPGKQPFLDNKSLFGEEALARKLILVVDQYEELITKSALSERRLFESELTRLSSFNKIIIILRAEFENEFRNSPLIGTEKRKNSKEVVRMKNEITYRFLVPEPDREDFSEIVYNSAEKAGMHYRSISNTANADKLFIERIIDDALVLPGSLAYLSATLHELFEKKADTDLLESVYNEIGGVHGVQQKLHPESFTERVERLYKTIKIEVADDLQKNRWGKKNERNGFRIRAEVFNKKLVNYRIVLIVEKIGDTAYQDQEIAFFLHDSFKDEIRYTKMSKGIAQLEISAYEAFTVGAYLANGTMMELDLNEPVGFPTGFYYKDVSKDFRNEVKELYFSRPVTVSDDLQKNRWGGKNINNGKALSATVKNGALPGYYRIVISLRSENPSQPFTGDLAFFMHDTFSNEIMFRKAINGEAIISVTAYEAFTVGAYTQDGTMLELDLNNLEGAPDGFYYED
jgi:hypothetical protein